LARGTAPPARRLQRLRPLSLILEQLVFELAAPEPPRLANFVPGRNAELLSVLPRFVCGAMAETGFFIWGPPGTGKTHLLHAAKALAEEHGVTASIFSDPVAINAPDTAAGELVIIDRIDEADAAAAGRLFTWFNALKERRGRLVAAARTPL